MVMFEGIMSTRVAPAIMEMIDENTRFSTPSNRAPYESPFVGRQKPTLQRSELRLLVRSEGYGAI